MASFPSSSSSSSSSKDQLPTPVWFITGASSGFGKHIALEALSRGHHVVATSRSVEKMRDLAEKGASVLALDVTASEDVIASVVSRAAAIHGRITHAVNAAGYVLEGCVEEVSQAQAQAQFTTNVLGLVTLTRHITPHLRASSSSLGPSTPTSPSPPSTLAPTLTTFGSLASWTGFPAVGLYTSTKWAVSGLTESLRPELAPFGIRVCVVEPGYFRTAILRKHGDGSSGGGRGDGSYAGGDNRRQCAPRLSVYEGTEAAECRDMLDSVDGKQPGDVVKGAKVVVDVLTGTGVAKGRKVPMRLVLGRDCVEVIRQKMRDTEELLAQWEEISCSTDHDDVVR